MKGSDFILESDKLLPTQKKVLIVLGKHENEYLTADQISKESGVNSNHVKQAIYKFMDSDWVFIDSTGYKEKVTLSPDGRSAYWDIR